MIAARVPDPALRTIVTPEGLGLPLALASRGARAGAFALDLAMLGLVMIGAFLALAWLASGLAGGQAGGLAGARVRGGGYADAMQWLVIIVVIGGFLLHNGWFLFFELGPRGATPGKRLLGIRVAARGGARLTADRIIARNLLRDLELFLPVVFLAKAGFGGSGAAAYAAAAWFALFALFPFFNRDRLRAGDLIAGTWVIASHQPRLLPVMSLGAPHAAPTAIGEYRFGDAELAIYGEHELHTLERVLREGRAETLAAVADAIRTKIGWTAPAPDETRAFLQAFYTQLRARLEGGMRLGKRKPDKYAA